MPERFSWIIKDKLAGMERPGSLTGLEEDINFLKMAGIDVIVNLEEIEREYEGFEVKHIPIKDFTPPSPEHIKEFVGFVRERLLEGKRVLVHCYAGMGRTNVMLACYLVHLGMTPNEALSLIKETRYFAVTDEQEEAIREYWYLGMD